MTQTTESDKDVRIRELETALFNLLNLESCFPLLETLKLLGDAADVLLHRYDYDEHGWEVLDHAYQNVEELKARIVKAGKVLNNIKD